MNRQFPLFSGFSERHKVYPLRLITRYSLLITILFLAACAPAAAVPTSTSVPTLVASLTPSHVPTIMVLPTQAGTGNIQAAVEGTLTALAPTVPPALVTPEVTPEATTDVITLPPTLGQSTEPPLDISLPDGWKVAENDALIIPDVDGQIRSIPFVAYNGPITGGQGTIVLLWGFPSLLNPFASNGTPSAQDLANLIDPSLAPAGTAPPPDLWSDGLRLLRLAIVEQGCNIGTDLKRTYQIGTLSGVGTQFAAVDCPQLPDTRGWFVGVDSNGLNFVFYAFSDPIQAMDTGRDDLQAILDTVTFHVPEATPTVTP